MRVILLLLICATGAYGQFKPRKLPASDEKYLTNLHRQYSQEFKCLKRVEEILASKWRRELEKIPTKDLGAFSPERDYREPSQPKYNTYEQEWLMDGGSAARQIDSCIRGLIGKIVPLMNQADIDCLNTLFARHVEEELVHEEVFEAALKREARNQLPFRRFISFTEFVEMMFQSRTPDALIGVERTVYEHAESFLTTEADRVDTTYIMEQECEWKNAKALRDAPSIDARFKEFERQVRDLVNQQLANRVVKKWNLNATLSRNTYFAWLQTRQKMMPKIQGEVAKLKTEKRDAQWLCERANTLAYEISDEESNLLVNDDFFHVELEVNRMAEKARGIEMTMKKTQDFRHPILKTLADEYENSTVCISAFLHLVQNHRRFDFALAFVDGHYNYPQVFCKDKNLNLGLIATRFCKCVGSFCVAHGLAALLAEEYVLLQGPDGTYKVVRSGVNSRKKVQAWVRN